MCTIFSQMRTVIVKPICIYIQDYELSTFVYADIHDGEDGTVTVGKYKNRDRAKEVLEEIFKSEYYEMPLE